MTATQAPCLGLSQEPLWVVAAQVKDAVRTAARWRIRSLSVEPQGKSFVLKGDCDAFCWRKDAIDAAQLSVAQAVEEGLIPVMTITDQIKVC